MEKLLRQFESLEYADLLRVIVSLLRGTCPSGFQCGRGEEPYSLACHAYKESRDFTFLDRVRRCVLDLLRMPGEIKGGYGRSLLSLTKVIVRDAEISDSLEQLAADEAFATSCDDFGNHLLPQALGALAHQGFKCDPEWWKRWLADQATAPVAASAAAACGLAPAAEVVAEFVRHYHANADSLILDVPVVSFFETYLGAGWACLEDRLATEPWLLGRIEGILRSFGHPVTRRKAAPRLSLGAAYRRTSQDISVRRLSGDSAYSRSDMIVPPSDISRASTLLLPRPLSTTAPPSAQSAEDQAFSIRIEGGAGTTWLPRFSANKSPLAGIEREEEGHLQWEQQTN